jgi:sec-independent protein translocase protein TatA
MFGIGGGEFVFIMLVILMFFGSDKIPEIARNLGKGMAQLRNATNDLKSEISKGMENNGLGPESLNSLTGGITDEIAKAKEGFTKMIDQSQEQSGLKSELDQIRGNFAKTSEVVDQEYNPGQELKADGGDPEGPIKRS